MAKHGNKAARIRQMLAEYPDASAKDIVAALATQRTRVTPAQVYNGKSMQRRRLKAGRYDALLQAKKLADAMGGIDRARQALDVLAKLM